jgi:DNA polymerase-3 subunit delta
MTAANPSEFAAILKSAAGKLDLILLHGADMGQVAELASSAAKALAATSSPPGEIIRLTEQDLAQAPGRLATEARMLAMFGGRPVIVVKQGPQVTPAAIEDLLDGPPLAAFVVIEAGALKKDAKLRQLVEKSKRGVAVACYGDDERSLPQLIREEVARAGLTIAPEAVQALRTLLGADRALSRAELAKLTLYAGGDGQIGLHHVEAVVGDASALAFDSAINAALAGQTALALAQIDRMAAAGTPPAVFLNLLLAHFQRLDSVAAAMERGESFDVAAGRLRPPLHFKAKDAMRAQASAWRPREVAAGLAATQEAVRQSRLKPALEPEIASALIIGFTRLNPRLAGPHAA